MKKIILIFLIALEFSFAQTVDNNSPYVSVMIPTNFSVDNTIEGSPYFIDNKFTKGVIYDGDKILNNIPMRFNAYNDQVEVDLGDDKIYAATKKTDLHFMIYGKYLYYIHFTSKNGTLNKGYLFCLECDSKAGLFKRVTKEFHEKVPAKSGYEPEKPASFISDEQLFIRFTPSDNAQPLETSAKKILAQFPDKQEELKIRIKEEKLNLKKEEDLIKLIQYYNSLDK